MSVLTIATTAPKAYWYLTRGTGAVALILLTASVALGVANLRRVDTGQVPRFVLQAVHRNVALLALAFTCLHVVTTLLDGFAPIHLVDVLIPFQSPYRTLWLGLGTVAFDLLLAVIITSLVRRRLGHGAWRATHWLAYASWPVALVHGFGTGSDANTGWMLLLSVICLLAVLVAIALRITSGWPDHSGTRVGAALATAAVPLALIVWLPSGPLGSGWAKRAGTPPSLLAHLASASSHGAGATTRAHPAAAGSFSAQASGTVRQGESGGGVTVVDISLRLSGPRLSALRFRIAGPAVAGGGVEMTSSRVTLGAAGNPSQYVGRVTSLQGGQVAASVADAAGTGYSILAQLNINPEGGSVSGTVSVRGN